MNKVIMLQNTFSPPAGSLLRRSRNKEQAGKKNFVLFMPVVVI